MKKWLMIFFVMVLSSVTVLGCSSSSDDGQQELVVVNWKDYGSDDAELIKEFEEEHNVKIVHQYMASEEELLTKLRTQKGGKIDLVLPNASILPVAIEEGLVEPIDTEKLTNYEHIFERFKNLPENQKNNQIYAVPWVWGSTGIAYNTDMIKEKIDTVQVLWDPKYKGKIAFRDDYNDAVMTAAMALGQDPNNPSDLEAIKKKLIEQKSLNRTYWKTGDEFSKLFAGKQVAVALMWSGQSSMMKKNGEPIEYVIPKEGAIGWVDYWAIVKESKNADLALKFIDFLISKDFQAKWVDKGGPNPVNTQAEKELDAQTIEELGINDETIEKLHFISHRKDEEKRKWNTLWQEVKSQ